MFGISKFWWCCGMVALVTVTAEARLAAADGRSATTITVKSMCEGCANKITVRLKGAPGVAAVATDLKTRTVTVTPQPRTQPSPKLLWEAVEAAGEQPIKLHGPAGTFTAKPRQ